MTPTLQTERLTLRPMRLDDFDLYAAFRASERSPQPGGPADRRKAWSMFCEDVASWSLYGYGKLVMEEKAAARPLGLAGVVHAFGWEAPELAWAIYDASDEGKGFAREAMQAFLNYCARTLGWVSAVSLVAVDNRASLRLADRLGGVEERRLEDGGVTYIVLRHSLEVA